MAKKLCLLGYTNQQLADFFKVQVQTINEWDIHIESFSKALQEGRDVADARVAISLYQRAVGYSHPAEQIVTLTEGRGGASYVERVPIVKQYPPDTAAAYIWLKNRRRDMWYDAGQGGGTPADDAARIAREAIRAALAEEDGPAALPPPEPEEDDDAV